MELLDVYDQFGNVTGKTIHRGEPITGDNHIALSVIFIENEKGEFLIQKTSKEKGENYTSTGGHVDHNETPKEAILREVKEELGVELREDEIIDYGFLLYDMPLRYLFYVKKEIPLEDIHIQEEEVQEVSYKSISEIEKLIQKHQMLESHGILFHYLLEKK